MEAQSFVQYGDVPCGDTLFFAVYKNEYKRMSPSGTSPYCSRPPPRAPDGVVPSLRFSTHNNAIVRATPQMCEPEGRPRAPVAEGGPVGLSDGGNRRDWFPRGPGAEVGLQARTEIAILVYCVSIRSKVSLKREVKTLTCS